MLIIKERLANVELEQHAPANKPDLLEGALDPKGISESGGKSDEAEKAQADKRGAKIHYYSRAIAR
jgi:hypothetical protein